MVHDWSGRGARRFPFWSRSEIIRVGAIAGLAIAPLSVVALEKAPVRPMEAAAQMAGGRLVSTRTRPLDVNRIDWSNAADAEPVR